MANPLPCLSKVRFVDIPEAYDVTGPVIFQVRIGGDMTPTTKDRIGLYRVGWNSVEDCITYDWVTLPSDLTPGSEVECTCTLKDNLPKAEDDFFQFCYIDSNSRVCGTSTPFQFQEDYDIVIIDDMESLLAIDSMEHLPKVEEPTSLHQLATKEAEIVQIKSELLDLKRRLLEKDEELELSKTQLEEQLREKLEASEMASREAEFSEIRAEWQELKRQRLETAGEQTVSKTQLDLIREELQESKKRLLEFDEKEAAYQEKEKLFNGTVQDLRKQLCHSAQEREVLKLDLVSVSNMLEVKQTTVDDLTKRCSKLSAEMSQMKKLNENHCKAELV